MNKQSPEGGSNQPELSPEERRKVWLKELAEFIVEANQNTWAADAGEVEPLIQGCKTHEYHRDNWQLIDLYTGYYRAPGMTFVLYDRKPAWTMSYGGHGMEEDSYLVTKETFASLRRALMHVTADLPFRGPRHFQDGEREYVMNLTGDLEEFSLVEEVNNKGKLEFSQIVSGGIVIGKDSSKNPVYPWD